ncbi:MAG: RNA polymerase sigma-I factor [Clostridiaceae bacterium]|jgi:RNA polymerase sigma factor|nr:RNA polymerase sigma-I factor [Clostridiaceae bacterium]
MENKQLEQWVLESKNDKQKLNDLLEVYKPFIMSCTQKISGRFLRYGSDDELTIAMMAFTKAVERYSPAQGDFLNFARSIIRSRVIDYYRSQKRHSGKIVYLQQQEEEIDDSVEAQASLTIYSEEKTREERILEIKALKEKLETYDINFYELENAAPRNKQTKQVCKKIISYLHTNQQAREHMLHSKMLPLSLIEKELGIKRKKFERHRKYIIAVLLIMSGDYPYLEEYVKGL